MSLPKQLYDNYKLLNCSALALHKTVTYENLVEFQNILNQAQPTDTEGKTQKEFVRKLYASGKSGFIKYVNEKSNRVRALILWTESKEIVRHFGLTTLVHIRWNSETEQYIVEKFVKPTK